MMTTQELVAKNMVLRNALRLTDLGVGYALTAGDSVTFRGVYVPEVKRPSTALTTLMNIAGQHGYQTQWGEDCVYVMVPWSGRDNHGNVIGGVDTVAVRHESELLNAMGY